MTRLRPLAVLGALLVVAAGLRGCGLGMIEIDPNAQLSFRIENGAAGPVRVSIRVGGGEAPIGGASVEGAAKGRGASVSAQSITILSNDAEVLVPGGGVTSGILGCGDLITLSASDGTNGTTTAELTGAGTGTPGFDSGSTSADGERFLLRGTDFQCGDSIVLQLSDAESGRIFVVPPGGTMPTTIIGDGADAGGPTTNDQPVSSGAGTITFRLENATPTDADFTIDPADADAAGDETRAIDVRVPAGAFSSGEIECGTSYVVSSAMVDDDATSVLYEGNGTGTPGFDDESIGFDGERLLLFGDHFKCGDSIVVRVTDDGTGIGPSSSDRPRGWVTVFSSGESLPDPDLPDPDQAVDEGTEDSITFVLVNQTESAIQGNFAAGNGSLASSGGSDLSEEFDVRVPGFSTTRGIKSCAQEYIVAIAHLESTSTTFSEGGGTIFSGGGSVNFHAVVLTGDGTGTDGFDENSISVVRGRLFQLGTHFECGDTITLTVTATNNQFKFDEEGLLITDEAGNAEILYRVGSGTAAVTPGG